jgi:hypothetical protein
MHGPPGAVRPLCPKLLGRWALRTTKSSDQGRPRGGQHQLFDLEGAGAAGLKAKPSGRPTAGLDPGSHRHPERQDTRSLQRKSRPDP